jgi:hypothetical protein
MGMIVALAGLHPDGIFFVSSGARHQHRLRVLCVFFSIPGRHQLARASIRLSQIYFDIFGPTYSSSGWLWWVSAGICMSRSTLVGLGRHMLVPDDFGGQRAGIGAVLVESGRHSGVQTRNRSNWAPPRHSSPLRSQLGHARPFRSSSVSAGLRQASPGYLHLSLGCARAGQHIPMQFGPWRARPASPMLAWSPAPSARPHRPRPAFPWAPSGQDTPAFAGQGRPPVIRPRQQVFRLLLHDENQLSANSLSFYNICK